MSINPFDEELKDIIRKYNISNEDVSKIRSAQISNLENVFVQGLVGSKIPLFTEYDFINHFDHRVVYYFELPHLEKYGAENLFALRYTGDDVLQKGIMHDSILIFKKCTRITKDGVYAVVSRNSLKFKRAELLDDKIHITPLDGKRRIPKLCKSASAVGRLVCCINNY